jgi:hypothetical protein
VHWGILRHLREEVNASAWVLVTAILLDVAVLAALLMIKAGSDMTVVYAAAVGIVIVFFGERFFLSRTDKESTD